MPINAEWPTIDPGEFRHKITLLEQVIGDDLSGSVARHAPAETPVVAWAKMEYFRGVELIKAGQDVGQVFVKLTMWYRPQFSGKKRIQVPSGSRFVIQSVENVKGMNLYQVLTCLGVGDND